MSTVYKEGQLRGRRLLRSMNTYIIIVYRCSTIYGGVRNCVNWLVKHRVLALSATFFKVTVMLGIVDRRC